MSLKVLTILGIAANLLVMLPVAEAQTTSLATCLPEFDWMNDSRNQSPCVVAAYMQGTCTNGGYIVQPLAPLHHYTGPTAEQKNPCQCSTVVYSLISACGMCQNRTIQGWSAWQTNCSVVYIQQLPKSIPSGINVPAWAYLDVVTKDIFSATAAKADISAPESTGIGSFKSTGVVSITPTSTILTIDASATNPITGGSGGDLGSAAVSKKPNAGAMTGSIVGGLVGFGITGLVVFFLIRHRQSKIAPTATYNAAQYGTPRSALNASSTSQYSYTNQPTRVYDPSDSSTYLKPPPSPTSQPGRYGGVPEL